MEEQESLHPSPITDDFSQPKPTAYELLMRQSRKMGGLATRTFDVTKEFLKQDVNSINADKLKLRAANKRAVETRVDEPATTKDTASNVASVDAPAIPAPIADSHTLNPQDNLRKIVRKSHQLLAGAQTVILPINLFPDSVIVDRTKVTVTKRTFFWTSSVISIRIEDVLNVACSTGPIFGSLTISSRVMNSTDHFEIDYFWRKDAIYLKQIIQGYVIAQHNQIDTSHLNRKELISTLLEIGRDNDY